MTKKPEIICFTYFDMDKAPDAKRREWIREMLTQLAVGDAVLEDSIYTVEWMENCIKYAERFDIIDPNSNMVKTLRKYVTNAKIVAKIKHDIKKTAYSARKNANEFAYEFKEKVKNAKRKVTAKLNIKARKNDAEAKRQGWDGWIDKQGRVHKIEKDGR